jgi:hypothetical protein
MITPEAASALTSNLERADGMRDGVLNFRQFYSAVKGVAGDNLSDQEIITIARHCAIKKSKDYDFSSMSAVAQDHLRKNNFEMFTKLTEVLQTSDCYSHNDRSLPVNETRCILKGFKLPLPDYLLDMLLQK